MAFDPVFNRAIWELEAWKTQGCGQMYYVSALKMPEAPSFAHGTTGSRSSRSLHSLNDALIAQLKTKAGPNDLERPIVSLQHAPPLGSSVSYKEWRTLMILSAGCDTYRTRDGCPYEYALDKAPPHFHAAGPTLNPPAPSATSKDTWPLTAKIPTLNVPPRGLATVGSTPDIATIRSTILP
jgi:hypothetical protein